MRHRLGVRQQLARDRQLRVHELNLDGLSNAQGIALETGGAAAKITKGLVEYELTVSGSRIVGTRPGSPPLTGGALVGAELRLNKNGQTHLITIDTVRTISYSYAIGSPGTLEAYRFSWIDSAQQPSVRHSLCANSPEAPIELFSMELDEAIVFETDRFDAASKTMDPVGDPRWFNIGCAGHTLAKMHLTRNTIASGAAAHGVSANDRQATLKMLVADYCGTGKAFTVAGEPLRWKGGAMTSFYTPPVSLEARWTHQGAACLNVPRLRDTSSPLAPELWPDLDAAVAVECSIRRALPSTSTTSTVTPGSAATRSFALRGAARRASADSELPIQIG